MKPTIKVVGNYVEGTQGGIIIEGWSIDTTNSEEALTLADLKKIAIDNNTFTQHTGTVPGTSAQGIRWYGDDPFKL